MSKNYNTEIAAAVRNYLNRDEWKYDFDEDRGVFRFGVNLSGRMKILQYFVCINQYDYTVYAISPISADRDDEEEMSKMAEFVCRANYGLRDGNFEMDFNDGELRYKCYVNCADTLPSMKAIEKSITCPAAMFSRYSDGIVQILFNDISPADAVAHCEEDSLRFMRCYDLDGHPSRFPHRPSPLDDFLRRVQKANGSPAEDIEPPFNE